MITADEIRAVIDNATRNGLNSFARCKLTQETKTNIKRMVEGTLTDLSRAGFFPKTTITYGCTIDFDPVSGAVTATLPYGLLKYLDDLDIQEMPNKARLLRGNANGHRERAEIEIERAVKLEKEAAEIEEFLLQKDEE